MPASTSRPRERSIERKSLDEKVAEQLRTAILDGKIPSGERLVELALAEEWQVGQGTIRAALKATSARGPGRSQASARHLCRVDLGGRPARDLHIAQHVGGVRSPPEAAEKITPAGQRPCPTSSRTCSLPPRLAIRARMLELDFRLHRAFAELCQHGRLAAIYASLESQTRLFLSMTEVLHHDLDQSVAHHAPLIDAIPEGRCRSCPPLRPITPIRMRPN